MTVTPVWKTSDGNVWDTQADAEKAQKMICYRARVAAVAGSLPNATVSLILFRAADLIPILEDFKNDPEMQVMA
jgi:hypothetical protein